MQGTVERTNQPGDGVDADPVPDKLSCLQEGQVYNHTSKQREPDSNFWPYGQNSNLICACILKIAACKLR